VDGACVEYECEDTDDGQDEHTAGTVTKGDVTQEDACYNPTTVKEYYCESGLVKSKNIQCGADEHCVEGACVEKELCEDSDGQDRFSVGTTTFEGETYIDSCYSDATVVEYYCENGEMKTKTLVCGIGYECVGGRCVEQQCEEEDMDEEPVRYEMMSDDEAKLYEGDLIEVEVGSDKFMLELVEILDNETVEFVLYESYADYLDSDESCSGTELNLGDDEQDVCGESVDLSLDAIEEGDGYVEISTGEDFNFVQYYVWRGTTYSGSGCPDDVIDRETSSFHPPIGEQLEGEKFKILGEYATIDTVDVSGETITFEFEGEDYDEFGDRDTVEFDGVDYEIRLYFNDAGVYKIIVQED